MHTVTQAARCARHLVLCFSIQLCVISTLRARRRGGQEPKSSCTPSDIYTRVSLRNATPASRSNTAADRHHVRTIFHSRVFRRISTVERRHCCCDERSQRQQREQGEYAPSRLVRSRCAAAVASHDWLHATERQVVATDSFQSLVNPSNLRSRRVYDQPDSSSSCVLHLHELSVQTARGSKCRLWAKGWALRVRMQLRHGRGDRDPPNCMPAQLLQEASLQCVHLCPARANRPVRHACSCACLAAATSVTQHCM